MDPNSSLQIPDSSIPGPSRQQGSSRAASVVVHPNATPSQPSPRKRASHAVASTQQQQQQQVDDQSAYQDVYSHPAAVAYAAAHPRRTIPKFGPYLLLQTLGEGEFGKVKLGLHSQWGEEVAVKLIRRGNIDTTVRMSKVEREIEVLRTLKHPNIVRLYDVIETDKYIGIILEYASGGELFDHILAHRYLKEKDAAKLFSQLISGVWYIHQKKIVHRDLKLENLLLDRHRNVIITDFGFANRFEHRSDDLMQTSCGSPCYAAPELVISEGLYVGSAVDIWSCGVILYAMLAGYLPFDDDPANPDGDNINLLYKYIVNTPLSFPDYISPEARDLLSMMLVPDPTRRADLPSVMAHPWLASYMNMFTKSVEELERAAMDQHQMKRLAYQRQMKQAAQAAEAKVSRSKTDVFGGPSGSISRSHRHHQQSATQPEYLYETSLEQSVYSTNAGTRKASSSNAIPATSHVALDDDPFGPPPRREQPKGPVPQPISPVDEVAIEGDVRGEPRTKRSSKDEGTHRSRKGSGPTVAKHSPEKSRKTTSSMRHTIQVEYDDPDSEQQTRVASSPKTVKRDSEDIQMEDRRPGTATSQNGSSNQERKPSRRPSQNKPLPSAPSDSPTSPRTRTQRPVAQASASTKSPMIEPPKVSGVTTDTPSNLEPKSLQTMQSAASTDSQSSKHSQHRRGLSVEKLGLGKIFGSNPKVDQVQTNGVKPRAPSDMSAGGDSFMTNPSISESANNTRPTTLQPLLPPTSYTAKDTSASELLSSGTDASSKKASRRSTLTVMVEPLSRTLKARSAKNKTADTPVKEKPLKEKMEPRSAVVRPTDSEQFRPGDIPPPVYATNASRTSFGIGMPASTSKARKVMQWFRTKSKRDTIDLGADASEGPDELGQRGTTPTQAHFPSASVATSSDAVEKPILVVTTPPGDQPRSIRAPGHAQRSSSTTSDVMGRNTLADRVRRSVGVVGVGVGMTPSRATGVMRIHHGAVDTNTITTRPPPEVMQHVREVLVSMGIQITSESEFKYRCLRAKRKKIGSVALRDATGDSNGLTAFTMVGTAASNGVDKRGLPVPNHPSFSATGGMLKGLLMRRQSSQVSPSGSQPSLSAYDDDVGISPVSEPSSLIEPVYGDQSQDAGDEVKFSVELTRLDRLNDTFSLDIRRLKGNLRSYKFLYDAIRERADLQR